MSSDIVSAVMKTKMKSNDVVFDICERMLNHSPERSYKRLNPALRSTLGNCIEADLPFLPDTFRRIFSELRGSWWFGDGAGSHKGEHFYTMACGMNHASAQQSFESFAERPACLWEEQVKTPVRLHVGARFTWKGQFVTVTSMRKDSLVACTYHGCKSPVKGLSTGAVFYQDGYWTILSSDKSKAEHVLRVAEVTKTNNAVVKGRYTILYNEIAKLRKTAKARVRTIVKQIEDPACDLNWIKKEVNAEHFRHFELEEINAAVVKRSEKQASKEKVSAWRAGENGAWLGIEEIILRVKNERVECSNGNSIKKETAIAVLPVILLNRKKRTSLNLPIDSYAIEAVVTDGVKVGCTLVPWSEIEYLARELKITA